MSLLTHAALDSDACYRVVHESRKLMWGRSNSKAQLHSPTTAQTFDLATASWRMESIVRDSDSSCDEDDEFFDCQGECETVVELSTVGSLQTSCHLSLADRLCNIVNLLSIMRKW